ncbi:hypothetical protein SAMN04488107_4119 [Geodermatophilus saharensis]|uniref:Uncharacterized protein n=1 Tax=Geodermatophilus saharensis TaxID=1137994 RepID=A0A239I2C0_9ACTN|nr:hypothetical protein [Geodermatophilus saharensis]SNS87745.1 hypothetical protein SAMN04488107_4119 [Geodermatophilus saharensis]
MAATAPTATTSTTGRSVHAPTPHPGRAPEHAWHAVALSRDLRPGGWLQVCLLGRTWRLRRDDGGLVADPPAWAVRERFGVVWLAPACPRDVPLELPEHEDRRFVRRWLAPTRAAGPAGPLADALLAVAQHRRPAVLREPFRVRLDLRDAGAATTVLHLLHPEDGDSTRVYTGVYLAAGPGRPLPGPDAVAAEVARQQRLLAEAVSRCARWAAHDQVT